VEMWVNFRRKSLPLSSGLVHPFLFPPSTLAHLSKRGRFFTGEEKEVRLSSSSPSSSLFCLQRFVYEFNIESDLFDSSYSNTENVSSPFRLPSPENVVWVARSTIELRVRGRVAR